MSSSQSPLSSVSACGENCARSLASPLPTARGAAGVPYWSCPKRKRAVHGPKEKGARRAPVQWPSARDGGRRIGACSDFAWPSGTLWSSASLQLPSRGGWYGGRRGARSHLSCFSFRAFRFATRYRGGRGGLYQRADEGVRPYNGGDGFRYPRRGRCPHRPVAEAPSTTGPAAAKSGAGCIPDLPRLEVSPRAARFRP